MREQVVGSRFNQDWAAFSFQRMMKMALKAADTGGFRTTGRLPRTPALADWCRLALPSRPS